MHCGICEIGLSQSYHKLLQIAWYELIPSINCKDNGWMMIIDIIVVIIGILCWHILIWD